ncbi:LCP family protein [Georgenia halophila]|uniref:LCP family protein n=1 Tax=Georgenia halophila TaxID=620889 RepID=A0ABP8KSL0_9MICO
MSDVVEHRNARTALVVALGMVLVLLAAGIASVGYLQSRLTGGLEWIEDPFTGLTDRPVPVAQVDEDGEPVRAPVNILVLGSDSRISAGDPEQWQAGAQRTDAIMVVQLSGDRSDLTVMSIPRDSWVEVPGHGMNKINAAFSFGGPTLMIQTVEHLTGIRIDHFAVADFASFSGLTDELGGVEIELTQPLTAGSETLEPGRHELDGEQALTYTRQRYNVAGGDFGRVQRQQNWMRAIMSAASDREVLSSPGRTLSLVQTITRSVAVDQSLTSARMLGLAVTARDLELEDARFLTAPYAGTGWSPDGRQSIVRLDQPRFDEVCAAFAEDRVAEYLDANPDAAPRLGEHVD